MCSSTSERLLSTLLAGSVPSEWARLAWPLPTCPLDGAAFLGPEGFFHRLGAAAAQLRTWMAECDTPKSLHWALLFAPQALVPALKQVACRTAVAKAAEAAPPGSPQPPAPELDDYTVELTFSTKHDPAAIPGNR